MRSSILLAFGLVASFSSNAFASAGAIQLDCAYSIHVGIAADLKLTDYNENADYPLFSDKLAISQKGIASFQYNSSADRTAEIVSFPAKLLKAAKEAPQTFKAKTVEVDSGEGFKQYGESTTDCTLSSK